MKNSFNFVFDLLKKFIQFLLQELQQLKTMSENLLITIKNTKNKFKWSIIKFDKAS